MARTPDFPPVQHQVWSGVRGFQRFNRTNEFSAPDPERFELARRSTTVDGARIIHWNVSSLSGRRDPNPERRTATLIAITDGSVSYTSDTDQGDAGVGTVLVVRQTCPISFSASQGTDIIEITMPGPPADGIPNRLTNAITSIPVTSRETALFALALYVLDPNRSRRATVARAIGALFAAVLSEQFPRAAPLSLRDQILDYIERNLHQSDLGPESIAAAFGISLRWAHRVFTLDSETMGRYIRARRIRFVQEQLRFSTQVPLMKSLAESCGFKSPDSLAKIFKAQTGLTVREYAAAGRGQKRHHSKDL